MWGEALPATATAQLRNIVSASRKLLREAEIDASIEYGRAGYRLTAGPLASDVQVFQDLVERARREPDDSVRARIFRTAIELWRGEPLDDVRAPFAAVARAALAEQRMAATEARFDAELAAGRHREVVAELTDYALANPDRDGPVALLMLALHRCGRRIDALHTYRSVARRLREEYGLEPSERLRSLEVALLRDDATLAGADRLHRRAAAGPPGGQVDPRPPRPQELDRPPSAGTDLGPMLRRYRLAARLTQQELADRSQLSVRTIRNLEAGRIQHPHGESVRLVGRGLGLADADRDRLTTAARGGDAPSAAGPLPVDAVAMLPPGGLIGRIELVSRLVAGLTDTHSIITLCGLSGVGKTALAAAVAHRLHELDWEIWWASCRTSSGGPPGELADAAAHVLPDDAGRRLAHRRGVLVLDAVEHTGGTRHYLDRLRAAHPSLRILLTSARPTQLGFEQEWIVPPLAVPPVHASTAAELATVSGVEMFVARLRQRRPSYELTDNEAPAVATLVRRLDGLPLALDLAAGHARIFTPTELLREYGSDMLQLTGSLRTVIERSVDSLGHGERRVLEEAAVFAGSWTFPLVAAVVSDAGQLERSVDRLCELGLVSGTQDDATTRFQMLDSVRHLVLERWSSSDASAAARRRHADAVLAAATRWSAGLNGPEQVSCGRELDHLFPDIVAALAVSERHSRRAALETAAALGRYWCTRSHTRIGRDYLERLLPESTTIGDRAHHHLQLARVLVYESDHPQAERHLRLALDLYEQLDDLPPQVDVLMLLTRALRDQGRFGEGTAAAVGAFRLAARIGDARRTASARNNLVFDDLRCGRYAAAGRRLDRVAATLTLGSRAHAIVAVNQAELLRLAGRDREARDAYAEAVALLQLLGEPLLSARANSRLAMCECVLGEINAAEARLADARRAAWELDEAEVPHLDLAAGFIARRRGDRHRALQSWRAALRGFERQGKRREMVEVGVLLIAVWPTADRTALLHTVERLRASGEFALTDSEQRALASAHA
ncbi:AfsR/SARP family transcriptional regulator [Micromonospora sp. 067-2]|uniref:AfsR/SARP family transcriptional regulator n=1 Tax=Micromonospora sp. 067-2 TaxID=2789270 RepID=UPI00397B46BD